MEKVLLEIALILASVKLAGWVSRRLGQPSVLGKLLVGVILGPALLGVLHMTPLIRELAEVGVILLLFLAGLETDVPAFVKNAGAATLVAILGVVLPFLGGWGVAAWYGYAAAPAIFVGVLLVATSVSISVQTLRELGRLHSRAGVTILAAAVLDDVLGVMVLSLVLGLAAPGAGATGGSIWATMGVVGGKMLLFFVLAWLAGRYLLPRYMKFMSGLPVGAPAIAGGIAAALAFAAAAEFAGVAGIVGAYVAGLALATAGAEHKLYHDMEVTTFAFFTPFFFVSVGLAAEIRGLDAGFVGFLALLTAVAIATKLLGCGAGALLSGFKRQEAATVGAGMVARGEVGLIVAAIGLDRGILTPALFTAMVAVALLTTLVTPPLLKWTLGRSPGPAPAARR